jgi:uncharacterized membrane protein (UPF0127 family)
MHTLSRDDLDIVRTVHVARTMPERMKGLLGKEALPENHGLLLSPCGSVHTFFMKFSLDLIFLDGGLKIVRFLRNVRPHRMAFGGLQARSVIEVQAGWLDADAVSRGDQMTLKGSA